MKDKIAVKEILGYISDEKLGINIKSSGLALKIE